jgi:two-component system OmpR family response regulator
VNLLLVDDDAEALQLLEDSLEAIGHSSQRAHDGEQALALLRESPGSRFDLILLDLQMPGKSGWDTLYELREAGNEIPVIIVSGVKDKEEKVRTLGLGADDYLVKPFDFEELAARIAAVVRRRETLSPIELGDLKLDVARRRIWRGDTRIELSPREFDLLLVLVRAKGELVTRDALLADVWDIDFNPGTNVVDVHVGRLRHKLDRHGPPLIVNERGKGFRIAAS